MCRFWCGFELILTFVIVVVGNGVHAHTHRLVCVGGRVRVWRVRKRGRGVSRPVFTREGWVVACSMNACTHTGTCVGGRVCCLVVVVLTLPGLRGVVVVVVVGGGFAPKPPRLVWDGVERLQST